MFAKEFEATVDALQVKRTKSDLAVCRLKLRAEFTPDAAYGLTGGAGKVRDLVADSTQQSAVMSIDAMVGSAKFTSGQIGYEDAHVPSFRGVRAVVSHQEDSDPEIKIEIEFPCDSESMCFLARCIGRSIRVLFERKQLSMFDDDEIDAVGVEELRAESARARDEYVESAPM